MRVARWTDDLRNRVNQTRQEGKKTLAVMLIAFAVRYRSAPLVPPFDDLYHLHRITSGTGIFDPERGLHGAFCPWPVFYDRVLALWPFGLTHVAALCFALFCGWVAHRFSWVAGLTVAVSPYLIGVSRSGALDHHWVEPALVLGIVMCVSIRDSFGAPRSPRRSAAETAAPPTEEAMLALAITLALLIQPALIVAAGFAFIVVLLNRGRGTAFALAALAILTYRLLQPPGYPDSAWFLGFPHVLALAGAAVACEVRRFTSAATAIAAGAAIALCSSATIAGLQFFGGDPWLESIVEFQPMFRDASRIGTDLANLTGGSLLALTLFRRHRTVAIFATGYFLLALSSRRFLVPAIPLFAIAGAMAVMEAKTKARAIVFAAMTILPPMLYHLRAEEDTRAPHYRAVGESFRRLPPGRVLAPWDYGHAIHILGHKPVVLDNFGSMPDPVLFHEATQALDLMTDKTLTYWCRKRGIRYVWRPSR